MNSSLKSVVRRFKSQGGYYQNCFSYILKKPFHVTYINFKLIGDRSYKLTCSSSDVADKIKLRAKGDYCAKIGFTTGN